MGMEIKVTNPLTNRKIKEVERDLEWVRNEIKRLHKKRDGLYAHSIGNLVGKYVRVTTPFLDKAYVHVEKQFYHGENVIVLSGEGFSYNFSVFEDETYFNYNAEYQCGLKIEEDKLDVTIDVITEEEYERLLYKGIKSLKRNHRDTKKIGEAGTGFVRRVIN